ncbi:MAG: hypothetical protein HZB70_00730 [Candidatus Berkelbacteria bacterium]|nr:MAG: hypothetical protein HZB70_00730 [Candidatus Berkelbacteria bacterium]QQG52137.1 MAG: hypothetical protein HY845_02265 [Candidatus Berkelbacteria bacterium]
MRLILIVLLLALIVAPIVHAQAPDQTVTKARKEFDKQYPKAKATGLKLSGKIVTDKSDALKPISFLEIAMPPKFASDGVMLVLAKKGKKEVGYTLVPFEGATFAVALKATWADRALLVTQLPAKKGTFDLIELRLLTRDLRRASTTVKG